MIRFCLIAIAALASLCVSALAQELPDDSNRNQLVVVGAADNAPATWFATDPSLAAVKKLSNWSILNPNSREHMTLYRERYQQQLGTAFPVVALMRPDGGVIYAADRNSIPRSAADLFTEMKSRVLMARNAIKSQYTPPQANPMGDSDFPQELFPQDLSECGPDGCYPPDSGSGGLLHPSRRVSDPFGRVAGNWITDSVSAVFWLIGSVVALGFFAVCGVVVIFVLYFVTLMWGRGK